MNILTRLMKARRRVVADGTQSILDDDGNHPHSDATHLLVVHTGSEGMQDSIQALGQRHP